MSKRSTKREMPKELADEIRQNIRDRVIHLSETGKPDDEIVDILSTALMNSMETGASAAWIKAMCETRDLVARDGARSLTAS